MTFFGAGREKEKIMDLTKEKENSESPLSQNPKERDQEGYIDVKAAEEKKKKLAKRILDMSEKIEELSDQIYHLRQRVEFLERKNNVT